MAHYGDSGERHWAAHFNENNPGGVDITTMAKRTSDSTSKVDLTVRDRKTMGQLVDLADGVVTASNRGADPHLDIPARTLSNVRYNKQKKFLEMGKATNRRQLFNLSQAKSYMQSVLVASGAKTLIEQGKSTSIRGLFYMLKHTIEGTREETFNGRKDLGCWCSCPAR